MMEYYAKGPSNVADNKFQPKELSLQVQTKSNMSPGTRMIGVSPNQQHTNIPCPHHIATIPTLENSQTRASISLPLASSLMPSQAVSIPNHNALTKVSSGVGLQQMSPLILQSPKMEEGQRDHERRIRREIANSNERRRMQSINAGFKSLKTILPHTDGEKLSKAAILQQTSEYITQLEADKLKLLHQNEKLRRAFGDCKCNCPKHRAIVTDIFDKDEGIGSPAEEDFEDLRRSMLEVRKQLDKERKMRIVAEEQVRSLETKLYPNKIRSLKEKLLPSGSSDERRSSSDYSPSTTRSESELFEQSITCLPSSLPPHTPLSDSMNGSISSTPPSLPLSASAINVSTPSNLLISPPAVNRSFDMSRSHSTGTCEDMNKKSDANQNSSLGQPITVFSHSTKSNQPLKKRAIEVHESYADTKSQISYSQQPRSKVARILLDEDETPKIGTRSFLPPTLPPISSMPAAQTPSSIVHTLPLPDTLSLAAPSQSLLKANLTQETTMNLLPPISHQTNRQQTIPPTRRVSDQGVSYEMPASRIESEPPRSISTANHILQSSSSPSHSSNTPIYTQNPPVQLQTTGESRQEVYTLIRGGVVPNGTSVPNLGSPVYLTMTPAQSQASATYIQPVIKQNVECVPIPSNMQPHLLVAPININPNQGMLVQDSNAQGLSPPSSKPTPVQVAYRPLIQDPRSMEPKLNLELSSSQPMLVQGPSQAIQVASGAPGDLGTNGINEPSQITSSIPHTAAVLCYRPPELTLNQLNAVPNLPPPRTLHQQLILPAANSSLVRHLSSNSPSYPSPTLQEAVLPSRISGFPQHLDSRRRKSSFSATDSCSTASISGAEEDETRNPLLEDPDCQSSESIPTIKLCSSESRILKSPRRRTSQHSCPDTTLVPPQTPAETTGTDVPDSASDKQSSETAATLSVLTNVAGSPPVIRRIDAIQTRRNLETIVQAIDHLEQQERRNSQDHAGASPSS